MDKIKLRNYLKDKRNRIPENLKRKFSNIILKNFLKHFNVFFSKRKNIFIYISLKSEVNTEKFIKILLNKNCNIFVPCIINKKIIAAKLSHKTKFVKGKYGILEPAVKMKLQNIKKLDLIIVPGIGFDRKGNRIGFGKGYFDRFLKKSSKKSLKIALAFSVQIIDKISANKHDIKMDYIVTEKEIIKCG